MGLYNIIKSDQLKFKEPILLLYFEESIYFTGHYQSLNFAQNKECQIREHNNWTLEKDQSRSILLTSTNTSFLHSVSSSPGSPGFSSSRCQAFRNRINISTDISTKRKAKKTPSPPRRSKRQKLSIRT